MLHVTFAAIKQLGKGAGSLKERLELAKHIQTAYATVPINTEPIKKDIKKKLNWLINAK